MYTILDYIDFYKDKKLDELKWNTADNLICAILVYLPIDEFKDKMNLKDFYNYSLNYKEGTKNILISKAFEIVEKIVESKRYENLEISNFENYRNNNTQFGAATFRINNITIISYKGTDNSLIGWIENVRLFYTYLTCTQRLAVEYLNRNIKRLKDNNIFVVGHSKGGNLAAVAAMETTNSIFNKINLVINFDGPGFMYEQINTIKYKNVQNKLLNIIPTGSIVGVILENENYKVVRSSEIAVKEHYPTSWNMFGEYFVNGKLSLLSQGLHNSTTTNIRTLNKEKIKETFETIFKNLNKEYTSNFTFNFDELLIAYNNLKNIDPEVKKNLDVIISSLLKAAREKKSD